MTKYELIAGVVAFALFVGFLSAPGIMSASCRTEAVKAGMKAEDIKVACGR